MTPAEWAAVLDALAKVEAVEAHHVDRARRDPRGLKLAQEAVRALRGTVTAAAPLTPVLEQPARPEWVSVAVAARLLRITPDAARMRARRGITDGTGRRIGRRLELHLPSQRES